ncbi:MAG: glutathione S-transferase N-terminal domain-containing protein [Betaproteobacteria bacterium]|jgi:glutathione S-transferase|uniref:Glutathione S-transferase N-terminal domain-containing protein n=1 Tax=Thiomonas arsenitoxydans (strain DSM 22701 / CIP 110005 / 3As) TaxID=426114 RepID=A0A8I1SWW9_THIA3|nr:MULTISPECIES: glutathione S-transferase N-terminal domain-containing protein [Thiomonas]MDE1979711.1 glutathione S-transferase N-terminal domain-containing protein [Betaproteobacteria bacterium]MBN8743961.1 glutathione S-transferase N-terminal domain-containing protein [Thiomonas arsenitoxydans]MDE2174045.1 glutathione S-transferase N-terminal domain-containing protein [Betaproteobacteria bacterium]MDE2268500.1 glutathione S-transferase N-terminal domain-containing protein [Betaproteobacteri
MKLIGSLTSPYVRKVRIMLAEKKIEAKWEEENVWSDATQIGRSNPLGKVPCLVLDDGEAIFDSRVIVEYLDTLTPVGKLIPAGGRERAEVRTWEALADGVMDAAATARLEQTWPGRTEAQRSPAWIARQMGKVDSGVKAMSHGLGDKPFCSGNHLSLADIAVGAALGYVVFRFPELGWQQQYPNLAKLYDKLMQRPSFRDTAPPQG